MMTKKLQISYNCQKKRRTFDQVPDKFKADVEAKLGEYGYDTNGDPIKEA